jgi:hypothetical protein
MESPLKMLRTWGAFGAYSTSYRNPIVQVYEIYDYAIRGMP